MRARGVGSAEDGAARPGSNHAALHYVRVCMQALCLIGEYNNWQPTDKHWAFKNAFGVWELFLPDNPDGSSAIPHR